MGTTKSPTLVFSLLPASIIYSLLAYAEHHVRARQSKYNMTSQESSSKIKTEIFPKTHMTRVIRKYPGDSQYATLHVRHTQREILQEGTIK
jgi:hypothetical protein